MNSENSAAGSRFRIGKGPPIKNKNVAGRMNQDGLAVDVRTITEEELDMTVQAFMRAWAHLKLSRGESGT